VDTHAGSGFYDFSKSEWKEGIGRLREATGELPLMAADYLKLSEKHRYSGSPVIMARALSGGDRLVCYELHPGEFETLRVSMDTVRDEARSEGGERPTVELRREDGPRGLKSLLPPPSRRGLILMDPSWEEQSEYESIPRFLHEGLKRFPEGTFIIWYPLLAMPKVKEAGTPLRDLLFGLSNGKRCRAELGAMAEEGHAVSESSPRGMYGSGLLIYNPPWTLRPALEDALPFLASTLYGNKRAWHLDWEG